MKNMRRLAGLFWMGCSILAFSETDSVSVGSIQLDSRDYVVVVSSGRGAAVPGTGTNAYAWRATVTCSVDSEVAQGLTNWTSAGWVGSGSAPASGGSTNTGGFMLTVLTSSITWNWNTNYWLEVTTSGSGSVDTGDGWYPIGATPSLVATPASGWNFVEWSGDASGENTDVVVTMDQPKSVIANFLGEPDPAYMLPWEETFEAIPTNMAGTLGPLDSQHGWTGGGAVQNTTVHDGAQALSISETNASHTFIGNASNVVITFWADPIESDAAPESIDANSASVFYVNTNGHVVAYNFTSETVLTNTTVSNGWNKFEIACDYSSNVWNLSLNDEQVVTNFAFYGAPSSFGLLQLTESSTNALFVDSITISDASDETDTDTDGLPDSWEEQYWPGDLSHNPGDPAANSDYTVGECYIAGISPIDSDAAFLLSGLQPLASEFILQWSAASGRVYSVYWTSNLLSGFGDPLTNLISGGVFTDATHSAESKGFYKIEVELAE